MPEYSTKKSPDWVTGDKIALFSSWEKIDCSEWIEKILPFVLTKLLPTAAKYYASHLLLLNSNALNLNQVPAKAKSVKIIFKSKQWWNIKS